MIRVRAWAASNALALLQNPVAVSPAGPTQVPDPAHHGVRAQAQSYAAVAVSRDCSVASERRTAARESTGGR